MHRNPAKHWRLSWFRYETFITFLTFRFSTRGERDTIFTMLTVPSNPKTHGCSRRPQLAWPRRAPKNNSPRLSSNLNSLTQPTHVYSAANNWTRLDSNLNKLLFSKYPAQGFRAWRHHIPSPFPIRGFYYDICDCHIQPARAWTPALIEYTYLTDW